MPKCCVPFCKNQKGKTSGISYHEFPVDNDLRNAWLRVISRENFLPNTLSNSSVVCSQHFTEADFKSGAKRKILRTGSIPSRFPNYPSHKVPVAAISRRQIEKQPPSNQVYRKRKRNASPTQEIATIVPLNAFTEAAVQTEDDVVSKLKTLEQELRSQKTKTWRLSNKLEGQEHKLRVLSERLARYENNTYHKNLASLISQESKTSKIEFLLAQIKNVNKNSPRWSEGVIKQCAIWNYCSPKGYKYARDFILKLPSSHTLSHFVGDTSQETGVTVLIKSRLEAKASCINKAQLLCSLVIDEMSIKKQLQYDRELDAFFGERDAVQLQQLENGTESQQCVQRGVPVLVNRLLCFMISGLSNKFRLPAAYFFTKELCGAQLHKLTLSLIHEIEQCGFFVLCLVADNRKTNVTMMKRLCESKTLSTKVPHPENCERPLFIAFDHCHILTNLRTLFLERVVFDGEGVISGEYVKSLYELQASEIIKPVSFLSRKHIAPTNFEKMNVKCAMEVFSPEVIAALKRLKDNRHIHNEVLDFSSSGATIKYMEHVLKWYTLHDLCSTSHHRCTHNDVRMQYLSVDDESLEWLQNQFLPYLESIKKESTTSGKQFLSNETYEAIKVTTISTVERTKYLLNSGFY